jgi:glycolate oxidase
MVELDASTAVNNGPDPRTTAGRQARCHGLYREALRIVGKDHVHGEHATMMLHSYDASLEQGRPDLVVAPRNTEQLRALIAATSHHRVPYVMRGAGTGYSGGSLPAHGGMVILTAALDRILATNFDEGWIQCEPGVVLATIQRSAESAGWRYLPDPSSHRVCTIGGNLAENAGGPHALGGGPTSNYVKALELVRPDGSIMALDDQQPWDGDLDLRSVVIGSEGTLGAVASATLRLVRSPEAEKVVLGTFAHQEDALAVVSDVFDTGLLPSAMDMLTGGFVPSRSDFTDPSLLFVGLQGRQEEVDAQADQLERCVRKRGGTYELLAVDRFLQRRAELVREKVRRMVAVTGFPRYYLFDAVAPRSQLARLMQSIRQAAQNYGLPVLNTFHAGDGNVHPTPFYDPALPDHKARLRDFSAQVLRDCRDMGGALSGEHGVGLEKQEFMTDFFSPVTLSVMRGLKRAFDPMGLSNPGKILPPESPAPALTASHRRPPSPLYRSPAHFHRIDALLELSDPATTFGDIELLLADSPYELPYEPLTGSRELSVLAALDAGLPGVREASPVYTRDLIVGADLEAERGPTLIELGGRCAKDVSGYELRKLVYGARGRLGRLSQVRLRVWPRPTDTQLARSTPLSLDDAISLCQKIHGAGLPFSHLGVLTDSTGSTIVTGRLELRGGTLGRHVDRLRAIDPRQPWTVSPSPRWIDPVMHALGQETMPLAGAPGVPWRHTALLNALRRQATASFASTGHSRAFWCGIPIPREPSALTTATISAFEGTP